MILLAFLEIFLKKRNWIADKVPTNLKPYKNTEQSYPANYGKKFIENSKQEKIMPKNF